MKDFSLHSLHSGLRDTRPKVIDYPKITRKQYPRFPQIALPPRNEIDMALTDVLLARRSARAFGTESMSLEALSTVLGHALALREDNHPPYPSGGGLYPIETYIFAERVTSLERGVYHYRPDTHALERLPADVATIELPDLFDAELLANTAAVILLTAVWPRTAQKYNEFGFELALMEAGHVSQTLILSAQATGIASRPLGSFREEKWRDILDLEARYEQVVLSLALGASTH